MEKTNIDNVNNPSHYKSKSGLEAIEVIEEFNLDYKLGNVVKYVLRHENKSKPIEDLKKARWYLDRKIKEMEGTTFEETNHDS